MPYMNPLVLEDLDTLNELAKLTWSWSVHYWTERGLEHGSYFINFVNPNDNTTYRVDGTTITEAATNAINKIDKLIKVDNPIPESLYP